jgi:hypothetical protein
MPVTPEPVQSPEARFRELIKRPDEAVDLAEAALLIAKSAYPDLDVVRYLARIEALAREMRARAGGLHRSRFDLRLNRFLFEGGASG